MPTNNLTALDDKFNIVIGNSFKPT